MSKILLLLLCTILLSNVTNGCLVVVSKNPDLGNCKCNVNLFKQEDIKNNKWGSYLGNQKVWDPIVTSTGCDNDKFGTLKVTCKPVDGVSSFVTVMFRSNGIPLYINRVINGQSTYLPQPRNLPEMDCRETEDGSYQWFYFGSPIQDLSLSCIADEDSCKCPTTAFGGLVSADNRASGSVDRCGYFNASCTRRAQEGTSIPFLFSDETFAIQSGSASNVSQFDEYLCLKEDDGGFNWYFSNLRITNPSVDCRSDLEIYGEIPVDRNCGIFKTIESVDDFEWYHRIGDYDKATFGRNSGPLEREFSLVCDVGFTPVVFSENNDPIEVTKYDGVFCTSHPMDANLKMWFANGTRLINPASACAKLVLPPETVPMNGCECPQIKYTDPSKIIQMADHSNWLARKPTVYPTVSVTKDCEVSFNAAEIGQVDFDFMLFRDEAPPIFMRRFLENDTKPEEVILSNLQCKKINTTFSQWQYGNSKITDKTLYVTAQINNPSSNCNCPTFSAGGGITMNKVNGSCDIRKFDCVWPKFGVNVAFRPLGGPESVMEDIELVNGMNNSITLIGLTCFNSDWYLNGQKITNPSATCSEINGNRLPPQCPCLLPEVFMFSSPEKNKDIFWERFSFLYPKSEKFKNREPRSIGYGDSSDDPCQFDMVCGEGDDTFVVFGMNVEPMIFPAGKKPIMRCVAPPLAGSLQTETYWWIDNTMVTKPQLACFERIAEIDEPEIEMNGCKCPQVTFIDQDGVKNMGRLSSWLGGKETLKPKITVSRDCEILIDKTNLTLKDHNIVMFRKDAAPLYMRRFLTSDPVQVTLNDLVCNQESSNPYWEYNGNFVSSDPIYLTVQLNTGSCSCNPIGNKTSIAIAEHGGVCDYMQMTCPKSEESITLIYNITESEENYFYNYFDLFASELLVTGPVCVDSHWYFNGQPMLSPLVECGITGVWGDEPKEFIDACRCFHVVQFRPENWEEVIEYGMLETYLDILDKNRTLLNRIRTSTLGIGEYLLPTCEYSFVCPDDSDTVVLSLESDPKIFPAGEIPDIKCLDPPLANTQTTNNFWWSVGNMMSQVFVTCLKAINKFPIEMNGCQCPPIEHIDQNGIAKMPESSYLNNRKTFRPEVTVSSTCEVTMDVGSMTIDKFFLMLFRNGKSPVFMRRFYTKSEREQPIQLTDLVCKQVLGVYQWHYNDLKLTDSTLYVALQSNQEMCGCPDIEVDSGKIEVTKNEERCDVLNLGCKNSAPSEGARLVDNTRTAVQTLMQSSSHSISMISATCVNAQWMYNGQPLTNPKLTCGDWLGGDLDFGDYGSKCPCSKIPIHQSQPTSNTDFWEQFSFNYDPSEDYLHKQTIEGDLVYNIDECSIRYTCRKYDQELVIFRLNGDPMVYTSGQTPDVKCVKQPSAGALNSENVWWIDDEIVNAPTFACYQRGGCKCPRIHDAIKGRVGVLPNSKYLEHRETFSARLEVTDSCEVSVDISKSTVDNFFLLFLRYPQNPLFFRRFSRTHNKNELHRLDDLKCVQNGDKYTWHHGTVEIAEFVEMTLLSDEECGCADFDIGDGSEITKNEESCNVMRIKAPNETWYSCIASENLYIEHLPWDVTIAELTCVNKTWYYNNVALINPQSVYCSPFKLLDADNCKCEPPYKRENSSFTFDKDTCKLNLTCPEGKSVFVSDLFYALKNFTFPPGTPIDVQCAQQPATSAFSALHDMQYWLNGEYFPHFRVQCI